MSLVVYAFVFSLFLFKVLNGIQEGTIFAAGEIGYCIVHHFEIIGRVFESSMWNQIGSITHMY